MKLNNNTNIFTPNIKNSDGVKITNQNKISSQKPVSTDKITFKSGTKTVARQEVLKNILPKFMLGTTFLAGLELLMHNANANNENNIKKLDSYDKELVKIGLPTKEEFEKKLKTLLTYDWNAKKYVSRFDETDIAIIMQAYEDTPERSDLLNSTIAGYSNAQNVNFARFDINEIMDIIAVYDEHPEQKDFIKLLIRLHEISQKDNKTIIQAKFEPQNIVKLTKLRAENPDLESFINDIIRDDKFSEDVAIKIIELKTNEPDLTDELLKNLSDKTNPLTANAVESITDFKEPKKMYSKLNNILQYCKDNNIKIDNLFYDKITANWIVYDNSNNFRYSFNSISEKVERTDEVIQTQGQEISVLKGKGIYSKDNDIVTIKNFDFTEQQKNSVVPNKYDVYKTEKNIPAYKIVSNDLVANGKMKIIEKNLENNGTRTNYFYAENKNGDKYTYINIKDSNKVPLNHKYKFKKFDDNHFRSIENGKIFDITYSNDKVTVIQKDSKDNEEKRIELNIGDNNSKTSLLSKDLLPLLKNLPGSAYFIIANTKTKIILENSHLIKRAHLEYNAKNNKIAISDAYNNPEQLFVLNHELGHLKAHKTNMMNDNDLKNIFEKERENFFKTAPNSIIRELYYFTSKDNNKFDSLGEMIAEVNAFLYSSNTDIEFELRGQYLQKYFPQTFAKIANLLLNTTSQKSFINKESRF